MRIMGRSQFIREAKPAPKSWHDQGIANPAPRRETRRRLDFLLECVGIPPGEGLDRWVALAAEHGEAVPLRGDPENHLRLPLSGGLEIRLDREPHQEHWTLLPHFRTPQRLRVAVEAIKQVPDSPFDALLTGWAAPPAPDEPEYQEPGAYLISTWLTDARRLPPALPRGHVLAISIAGFALHVDYLGPNSGVRDSDILEKRRGAEVTPLGGADNPGGCSEVSLRIKEIVHLQNRFTNQPVDLLWTDSPGRPLPIFLSPWQLEADGLPMPRPGWRIEGAFLFTGTLAGGLPGPKKRAARAFG